MDVENLLSRSDAVEQMLSRRASVLGEMSVKTVPLDEIPGRTLVDDVVAETDHPEHSIATMDGFAFDATDDYPLEVIEDVFPEDDPPSIDPGTAVRIATGAPLPERANAVLKKERAAVADGELTGPDLATGTDTYERGSNVEAGERLFEAGERLSPKDAILLRDVGIESVGVHERFSVGVLGTGSELVADPTEDLDSPMLCGLVRSWGHEATYEGAVADDYDEMVERLDALAREHDVLLTTGGTSVGRKDYTIRALESLGTVEFQGVALRPGKPVALATLADHDATVIAIPGKPLGAHTAAALVARPFFVGETELPATSATMSVDVDVGPEGFEYCIPVTQVGPAEADRKGQPTDRADRRAMPLGHRESSTPVYETTFDPSVVSSTTRVTRADGFVLSHEGIDAGTTVSVVPYPVVE